MLLYFQAKLSELRLTYHEFFEVAYQWKFNPPRMPMLNDDEAQFFLHGILPRYVTEYLSELQRKEVVNLGTRE